MSGVNQVGNSGYAGSAVNGDAWIKPYLNRTAGGKLGIDVEKVYQDEGLDGLNKLLNGLNANSYRSLNLTLAQKQDIRRTIRDLSLKDAAKQESKEKLYQAAAYTCKGLEYGSLGAELVVGGLGAAAIYAGGRQVLKMGAKAALNKGVKELSKTAAGTAARESTKIAGRRAATMAGGEAGKTAAEVAVAAGGLTGVAAIGAQRLTPNSNALSQLHLLLIEYGIKGTELGSTLTQALKAGSGKVVQLFYECAFYSSIMGNPGVYPNRAGQAEAMLRGTDKVKGLMPQLKEALQGLAFKGSAGTGYSVLKWGSISAGAAGIALAVKNIYSRFMSAIKGYEQKCVKLGADGTLAASDMLDAGKSLISKNVAGAGTIKVEYGIPDGNGGFKKEGELICEFVAKEGTAENDWVLHDAEIKDNKILVAKFLDGEQVEQIKEWKLVKDN